MTHNKRAHDMFARREMIMVTAMFELNNIDDDDAAYRDWSAKYDLNCVELKRHGAGGVKMTVEGGLASIAKFAVDIDYRDDDYVIVE
jgi:hypothetical protein